MGRPLRLGAIPWSSNSLDLSIGQHYDIVRPCHVKLILELWLKKTLKLEIIHSFPASKTRKTGASSV